MQIDRFKTFASIMIAVVTVLSATAACLGSIAETSAGEEDFEALTATVRAQESSLINSINMFEHLRAYTTYYRHTQLVEILLGDPSGGTDDVPSDFNHQVREARGIALGLQYTFFPPRYLNPDGSYDSERELDEAWAEAGQQYNLNPAPHFEQSDVFRSKSLGLTGLMTIFATSFWFFTLAQGIENRFRYAFGIIGVFLALAGMLGIVIIEVML